MEIVGRLTADAAVKTVSDNRSVVNFTVAINDYYRRKGSTEAKKITTFVQCAYWISSRVAEWLSKGVLVQLQGRIGVNAWNGADGTAKASLTMHVSGIKTLSRTNAASSQEMQTNAAVTDSSADDLPF